MLQPSNAAASEIVRLQALNRDLDEQTRVLEQTKTNNLSIIETLDAVATWQETVELPEQEE